MVTAHRRAGAAATEFNLRNRVGQTYRSHRGDRSDGAWFREMRAVATAPGSELVSHHECCVGVTWTRVLVMRGVNLRRIKSVFQ